MTRPVATDVQRRGGAPPSARPRVNVPSPPAGSAPAEPRDVAALRQLRTSSPDLAPAIDFQLAWLQTERRVDSRVQLPRTVGADALCAARLAAGARVLEFDDLVLDWSDVRRLCGQAADLLRRADFLEPDVEAQRAGVPARRAARCRSSCAAGSIATPTADAGAAQVWTFGLRPVPHARRCGAAAASRRRRLAARDLSRLRRRRRVRGVERRRSPARLRSLRRAVAVRSGALSALPGRRRVVAAELLGSEPRAIASKPARGCRRYVKGLDEERAGRAVLIAYDPIATIPLDAAAAQLGFE